MAGEPGTEVTISVLHPSATEAESVTLKRELIQQPTVLGYRRNAEGVWDYFCDPDHKIGYIRLAAFSRATSADLAKVLQQIPSLGLQGLVLDLRFNPGGMLNQAIEVSDLFLHEGRIVSVVGRANNPPPWDAHEEGTLIPPGFPLAVLVNRFSASAAEIVSACLQDHGVAVIVGERTWGKGSVQNIIQLDRGKSALKLTTAGYQRPSGKNIHRGPNAKDSDPWGVTPNEGYAITYSDADLLNLGNRFNQLDALAEQPSTDGDVAPTPEGAPPAEFVDRQLEKALEYLRGKIQPEAAPAEPGSATKSETAGS
jgi:carboxyl-terminal processing protease